jgi:hypothetical protein
MREMPAEQMQGDAPATVRQKHVEQGRGQGVAPGRDGRRVPRGMAFADTSYSGCSILALPVTRSIRAPAFPESRPGGRSRRSCRAGRAAMSPDSAALSGIRKPAFRKRTAPAPVGRPAGPPASRENADGGTRGADQRLTSPVPEGHGSPRDQVSGRVKARSEPTREIGMLVDVIGDPGGGSAEQRPGHKGRPHRWRAPGSPGPALRSTTRGTRCFVRLDRSLFARSP